MRHWIRRWLPSEERLRSRPGLRWLAPLLRRPALWHLSRRRVALGAGIGVFFGFLIPVAQIAGAAVVAVLLRANLPVAAVATLVSNPVTYGPIFLLAYRTGAALLGEPVLAAAEAVAEDVGAEGAGPAEPGWLERAQAIGRPLILGLFVFAVVGGVATWGMVHACWILAVHLKRRQRVRRRTQDA